jgi:F-type H+-transporting ATPase subunit delta
MTESQIEALKAKLIAETGKKIIIKNTVDPTILGGVKLRYSGKQIDGSVKTRLDAFSESLKNIIV